MRTENGQATVEMAFSLIVLILILFGITDFGRIFHAHLTLEHASREAARLASVGEDNSGIIARAKEASAGLDDSKLQIVIDPSDSSQRTRGTTVTVSMAYQIDFLTPVIGQFFSEPLTLENQAVMRVE